MRPAVGLFAFVHKKIDLKKMFMILTILASVAEEESHSKSIIMNWSIDRRFSRGLFLTPALLGSNSGEIKCMALVRMIYGDSGWDKKMSYRLIGRAFPQQRLVSFKITDAMQIENGRVLTEM